MLLVFLKVDVCYIVTFQLNYETQTVLSMLNVCCTTLFPKTGHNTDVLCVLLAQWKFIQVLFD